MRASIDTHPRNRLIEPASFVPGPLGERLRLKGYVPVARIIDGRSGLVREIVPFSENLIVTEGRNHIGDTQFTGSTQVTAWFVGLLDGSPTLAPADVMNSHAGWTEITAYSEATRPAWVETRTANGTWDNAAAVASYSINASTTVGGVFLVSVSTKGGTTGVLYSEVGFSGGNRALNNGDTLEVTYTQTTADDGS